MYKQGDILLIPIPFSDLQSSKKRPVLVFSNDLYNITTEDIVVMAITSNIQPKEYTVLITKDDLIEGEIKVDSNVRVDKIYTLSKSIVIKRIGCVNKNTIEKVKNMLDKLF